MKKTVLILFAASIFLCNAAISQSTLNIFETDSITTKELKEVQSIHFSDRNLNLNLRTGEVVSYALSNVQKIEFDFISSIVNQQTSIESTAVIYPNPSNANDELNMIFKSELQSPISVTIYSLDGAIKKYMEFAPNEGASFSFQLPNFHSGMYIAVVRQADLVKIAKIIIQ